MDAHTSTQITDARVEGGFKLAIPLMVAGAIAVGVSCALGLFTSNMDTQKQFLHAYLTALMYFLAIALGGLFFVILQHLVAAKWSMTIRRVAECVAMALPVLGVLALPVLIAVVQKNPALYVWLDQDYLKAMPLVAGKGAWLNSGLFAGRMIFYFAVWSFLAYYFYKSSTKQDETGDAQISLTQRTASAPAMIAFAFTSTFAAFDLIMSLTPTWYSTIFGVYYFASCAMSFFAMFGLLCMYIQKNGGLKTAITTEHYHDIGKFLFTFVFFWGYISFSQFMLIWYSNIPEETEWFKSRMDGAWLTISIVIIFAHFLIPFVGLMSRNVKRNRALLAFWSVWLLAMHYVQMFWLVKHNYDAQIAHGIPGHGHGHDAAHAAADAAHAAHHIHVTFNHLDVLCFVGIGLIFLGNTLRVLSQGNMIAIKEPRLEHALAFHNI